MKGSHWEHTHTHSGVYVQSLAVSFVCLRALLGSLLDRVIYMHFTAPCFYFLLSAQLRRCALMAVFVWAHALFSRPKCIHLLLWWDRIYLMEHQHLGQKGGADFFSSCCTTTVEFSLQSEAQDRKEKQKRCIFRPAEVYSMLAFFSCKEKKSL